MTEELISLKAAAERVGVKPYILTYAIQTGHVPEPRTLNGRRAFGSGDIEAIEKYLMAKKQKKEVRLCKTKPS